jgi:hypothetical protein
MAIGRISGSVLKSNLTRNGTDLAFETNLLYLDVTNSRVGIGTSEPSQQLHVSGTTKTTNLTVDSQLTIGSQVIKAQGTNGFSVNEDFDPSNDSSQTAYHFTSGAGRSELAFTLARTGQFTDGFGIYGTSANNTFVSFGEQSNTNWEWRSGVGIQPLDLDGGSLRMKLDSSGNLDVYGDLSITGSFSPGSISISDNIITTNTSNADLELTANGSGNVAIKSTRIQYTNSKYIIKEYILYGTTTDALETEIFINGTSNNRIPIQTDSTVNYTVDFTARRTDVDGTSAGYQLKGVIDNNSGTVADVGNVYEIMVSEDDVNLAVDARADNTNKSLDIFVQGTSGATFAWLACVKTYEVIE